VAGDGLSALLAREAASLVGRLRLFTPARWSAALPPYGTRADAVHHLAQALADAEGSAPVRLPRLDSDLALPDQLAVTADDLVRSGRADADAVAHLLLHRADLLEDEVPAGLARELGEPDGTAVLARGRRACGR
jgi:hypothetical protein